ncbi:DUF2735 domain-containing protein [Neorhizobium sp. DT-125]|uniref:DUF2735 domain-containing protein n=1 Tax=Neorhizobium sp. DT-125 TaxID=3396163 RepID=UPI003F1D033E
MTTDIRRDTAKIYQFPVRPRRRLENGRTASASIYEMSASVVDDCWYHDEAVKDEAPKAADKPKPC